MGTRQTGETAFLGLLGLAVAVVADLLSPLGPLVRSLMLLTASGLPLLAIVHLLLPPARQVLVGLIALTTAMLVGTGGLSLAGWLGPTPPGGVLANLFPLLRSVQIALLGYL
jgi:hypothetical protein